MLITVSKIGSAKSYLVRAETGEVLGSFPTVDAALASISAKSVLPDAATWEASSGWEQAIAEAKREADSTRHLAHIAYWNGGDVGD